MDYPVVLVNVSIRLERYNENGFIFIFFSFAAGRDGVKGEKGDGGRHGKI